VSPTSTSTATDRELALRLGALMLHVLGSDGGAVLRAMDDTGLTFVQMKALFTIAAADPGEESTSVKSLAERLGVSVPSASRAADDLVKKGLATRDEDPEDRRVRRIALTAKGDRLAGTVFAARLRSLERFSSGLEPAERNALESALELLLEREEIAAIHRTHSRRSSSG
jgi:DNA-binding MarR family transcriptional regulator